MQQGKMKGGWEVVLAYAERRAALSKGNACKGVRVKNRGGSGRGEKEASGQHTGYVTLMGSQFGKGLF